MKLLVDAESSGYRTGAVIRKKSFRRHARVRWKYLAAM
jgi:hypothetical protein